MAYYYPCMDCTKRKGCAHLANLKSALSGFGMTSIKFKCPHKDDLFKAGNRVNFNWGIFEVDECTGEADLVNTTNLDGTVVSKSPRGTKYIVRVDSGPNNEGIDPSGIFRNDDLVVRVKPADMAVINEPDRNICPNCSAYDASEAKDKCHSWAGEYFGDFYHPEGCLRTLSELKK